MSLAESLDILFEDNHCIAVNKPAGWPTTHFAGEQTVDRLVKSYLKEKHQKPGKVFLGVVHRLDKPASGVLLFARTSKAAARLAEQFREAAVEKVYWAVCSFNVQRSTFNVQRSTKKDEQPTSNVEGPTLNEDRGCERPTSNIQRSTSNEYTVGGTMDDWLWRDDENAITRVVESEVEAAQRAVTHYSVRATHGRLMLLDLRPQTGRKHQLRAQLASRGMPIYGDLKYGSKQTLGNSIALHARSLTFLHPTRHEPITLTADVPPLWRGRFAHLLK